MGQENLRNHVGEESPVLSRVFPRQFDNEYGGSRLAIGLFVPLVLVNLIIGTNTMLNTQALLQAEGIPLASYDAEPVRVIVKGFKSWGLGHVLLFSLGLLALLRYRAMIPLMYLVFVLENLLRKVVQSSNPFQVVTRSGEPSIGALINLTLLVLLVLGLALSLAGRKDRAG
jgi:hypothetical protein